MEAGWVAPCTAWLVSAYARPRPPLATPGGGKVQLPDAVEVDGEFLGVGGGDCAVCTVADIAAGVAGTVLHAVSSGGDDVVADAEFEVPVLDWGLDLAALDEQPLAGAV